MDMTSSSTGATLDLGPSSFPFRFELSLDPLIAFWTRSMDESGACGAVLRLERFRRDRHDVSRPLTQPR